MFFLSLPVAREDEIDGGGVREFWGAAKAAVLDVKKLGHRLDLRFDDTEVEIGTGASENFGLRDGVGEGVGGAFKLRALVAVRIGHGKENAAESRAAHPVFRGKICATEERLSVGKKKTGERPAALAGNGANGGLVAGADVRAFVAIDFHGDEMFVDDFGDFGVLVAFAVDDMAPVAPDGADIEEDGLVFGFGTGESGFAPFVPVDRLVRGGAQVGTRGVFQPVFRMVGQTESLSQTRAGQAPPLQKDIHASERQKNY